MESGTKGYFDRVLNEINLLKQNATKEELSQLNFETLNPDNGRLCIYGQITGDCFSNRAFELIQTCCKTTISFPYLSKTTTHKRRPRQDRYDDFSFLEHCIAMYPMNNLAIIQYLKGERTEINLFK